MDLCGYKRCDFLTNAALVYAGKTKRSTTQGIELPQTFDVTNTPNHWIDEEKAYETI